jgi:mRNA interferase MazF
MNFGEIFLCSFPFTSGAASKVRPVLVLFDLGADVMICRISAGKYSGPLDVSVKDWSAAGLAKPSVIRLSRIVTAEKSLLTRRLGKLATVDLQAVRNAWNTHMTL